MTGAPSDLEFTSAAYDRYEPPETARRCLFLCTSPRSGSHRLSRALYDLGIGVPTEYFQMGSAARHFIRWNPTMDFRDDRFVEDYWQHICRWRTRGGVVAVTLFGYQQSILHRLLERVERPRFVYLHRRRLSDQVASLLALYQTKMPYADATEVDFIPGIEEVSARSIRIVGQWLRMQNRKWRTFFTEHAHIAVASEDFFASPAQTLEAVFAHCPPDHQMASIDSVAAMLRETAPYPINAQIKRRIQADFGSELRALDEAVRDEV